MSKLAMIEEYKELLRGLLREKLLSKDEMFIELGRDIGKRLTVVDFQQAFEELYYGDELLELPINVAGKLTPSKVYKLNVDGMTGEVKPYMLDSDYKVMIETIALARYILANSEVDEFHSSMQNVQKECEESLVKEGYALEQVKKHSIARYKELLKQSK